MVKRGSVRQVGRELGAAAVHGGAVVMARMMRSTGLTSLAVALSITAVVGVRAVSSASESAKDGKRERGARAAFAEALESLGRDLHAFTQKYGGADFQTHSEGEHGWLLREQLTDAPIVDVTSEFHAGLVKLGGTTRRDQRTSSSVVAVGGGEEEEEGEEQQQRRTSRVVVAVAAHPVLVTRSRLIDVLGAPRIESEVAVGWDSLTVLLVPGLWTKWYPRYFSGLVEALKRCAIDFHISRVDSDATLAHNADILVHELQILTARRSVVIYAHSKGAIDASCAIGRLPAHVRAKIACFVSCQGPHGGSLVGNDVLGTRTQKSVISFLFSSVLGGSGVHAVSDLAYASRRRFFAENPERWWLRGGEGAPSSSSSSRSQWVPTICLCSAATHQPRSLLSPIVEYYRYRYECAIDGLCARDDTALPGAPAIFVSDMDHFGPAWSGFPSTDRYDSTHVFFVLVAMVRSRCGSEGRNAPSGKTFFIKALDHRNGALVPRHRPRPRLQRSDTVDANTTENETTANEETEDEIDAGYQTPTTVKNAISRACSWGFFDPAKMTAPTSPRTPS